MTLKIGIVGMGFMGRTHLNIYTSHRMAQVIHICDLNPQQVKKNWKTIKGNLDQAGKQAVNLDNIRITGDYDELLNSDIDIIDICLPTHLHSQYAVAALKAGKHTFCEKPMGIDVRDSRTIQKAAENAAGLLQIGHCIRFWPEYAAVKKAVQSNRFGRVLSAEFIRVSAAPTWSHNNWLMQSEQSGGAALDLHIHDTDFVNYLFGRPRSVSSVGFSTVTKGIDYIATRYNYDDIVVRAEGGWINAPRLPFQMEFTIVCEKGTMKMNAEGFNAYTPTGKTLELKKAEGDGWAHQLDYFLKCVRSNKKPEIVTPADAVEAVEITWAEIKSARNNGRTVRL